MAEDFLSQDEIDALLTGGNGGGGSSGGGEGALSIDEKDILKEVASIIANASNSVIGMLAGRPISTDIAFADTMQQNGLVERVGGQMFAFAMNCDGLDNAPARLVTSDKGALALADLMMGGDAKELPEEANDLYLSAAQEGLSQLVGSAMTSISGLLKGAKFAPANTRAKLEDFSWMAFDDLDPMAVIWAADISVTVEDVVPFNIILVLKLDDAKNLASKIHQMISQKEAPKAPAKQPAAQKQAPAPPQQQMQQAPMQQQPYAPQGGYQQSQAMSYSPTDVRPAEFMPLNIGESTPMPGNIDLVVDIPVRITVELGRTRKTIGEILSMGPGAVVELNKMAGEPVDVLVNGKLIARGEVVVIDESFGIRLTEIVSRSERIRSMGI